LMRACSKRQCSNYMNDIGTTKVLSISECGHDEYWFRDRIFADPAILSLGTWQQ
jgi:hypothetical protein